MTYVAMIKVVTRAATDEPPDLQPYPRPSITKKGLLVWGLIGLGAGLLTGLIIDLTSYQFQQEHCS